MKRSAIAPADERLIRALHTRKQRTARGVFLIEGVRVTEEALDAGLVLRLALVSSSLGDSERGRRLRARLEQRNHVHDVPESLLRRLAATESPQGVLLVAEEPQTALDDVPLDATAIVVVLDAVQDPGNFGTLVRNADAFGAAAVVALPGTVDPWNPKAVRAAAGSSFHVPIAQLALSDAMRWLRDRRFRVLAADAGGAPADSVDLGGRVALIVGNEGSGLREETRAAADAVIAVPIAGRAESLNVAVAAGILLDRIRSGRS